MVYAHPSGAMSHTDNVHSRKAGTMRRTTLMTGVATTGAVAAALLAGPQSASAIEGGGGATGGTKGSAAIFRDMERICSGSMVNQSTVLTAKHCVEGDVGDPGKLEVTSHLDPELGQVAEVTIIRLNGAADIAILHLKEPIRLSTTIAGLSQSEPAKDTQCAVFGYGKTSMGGPLSDQLKVANVRWKDAVPNDPKGAGAYLTEWINGQVREGDSGGPVFCGDNDGIQQGITVQQVGDREGKALSVSHWRPWIVENTAPSS